MPASAAPFKQQSERWLALPADALWISGLFLLALVPRLLALGAKSLWLDEAASAGIARLPWLQFWRLLSRHEANMGLYYLLLRGWLAAEIFRGAFWLRLPSAICGAFVVPLAYLILRRGFDRFSAAAGAALLALSPFEIQYSQDARAYALALLLSTLSALLLLRALESNRPLVWLAFDLSAIAAVYSHFFAGLVLAAEAVYLLWLRPAPRIARAAACNALLILAALSPLALFVILHNDGQLFWVHPFALHILGQILGNLAGAITRHAWTFWPIALLVYGLFIYALCAFSLPRVRHSGSMPGYAPAGMQPRRVGILLLCWFLMPLLLSIAVSFWQPVLVNRFLLIALPPVPMLAGVGLARLRARPRLAAAGVYFVLAVVALARYYRTPNENWRAAAAWLARQSRPGDVLLVYAPYCALPLEHYLHRQSAAPRLLYPHSYSPYRLLTLRHGELSPNYGGFLALQRAIWTLRASPGRVWVVSVSYFHHFRLNKLTMRMLRRAGWPSRRYRFASGRHFHGVDIARFDLRPAVFTRLAGRPVLR